MIETVLAVTVIVVLFFYLFRLSQVTMSRTLMDHAAARAARARAVGFNDFMCLKSARVAAIPVAGRCTWPDDSIGSFDELWRIPDYLQSEDNSWARGILDYEFWPTMKLSVTRGIGERISAETEITRAEGMQVKGASEIESHYPLYLNDGGF